MQPNDLHYELKVSKRSKRISAKVLSDGTLRVVAPAWIRESQIRSFLNQHYELINRHRQRVTESSLQSADIFSGKIQLLGRHVKVHLLTSVAKSPARRLIKDDELLASYRGCTLVYRAADPSLTLYIREDRFSEEIKKDALITAGKLFKTLALHVFEKRIRELSKVMKVTYRKVGCRYMISRFGSCSSKGDISLNWRLLFAPLELSDYVMIHELAHLKQMNHSAKFWKIVKDALPDYKQRSSKLKKEALMYDLAFYRNAVKP